MSKRLSQFAGMNVYTDNASYLGKVFDIIIDLQKGEVIRLTLEPIKATSKEEAKKIFREKTILYSSVKAADKIIIVTQSAQEEAEEEKEEAEPPKKPYFKKPYYSYRYVKK